MKKQTARNSKEEFLKDRLVLDVNAPDFNPKETHYQFAMFAGNSRVLMSELLKDFKLRPFQKEFEMFTCLMGAGGYFHSLEHRDLLCMCMFDAKITKIVKKRNLVDQACDMRAMIEFLRKG